LKTNFLGNQDFAFRREGEVNCWGKGAGAGKKKKLYFEGGLSDGGLGKKGGNDGMGVASRNITPKVSNGKQIFRGNLLKQQTTVL